MGEVSRIQEHAPTTHGGARAGAGRKRDTPTTADFWLKFERRIRAAASKEITREKMLELAKADPWRFIERVVIPLIGIRARASVRLGVKVEDGEGGSTQFVLDLGGPDPAPAANDAHQVSADDALEIVAELERFGAGR